MITHAEIEILKALADAEQNDTLYITCAVALALGPTCYGWFLCEEEIEKRRTNG